MGDVGAQLADCVFERVVRVSSLVQWAWFNINMKLTLILKVESVLFFLLRFKIM